MKGKGGNPENLIPFNIRSEGEARESGKKGGVASGEARRRKRDVKETLSILLQMWRLRR